MISITLYKKTIIAVIKIFLMPHLLFLKLVSRSTAMSFSAVFSSLGLLQLAEFVLNKIASNFDMGNYYAFSLTFTDETN